MTPLTNTRNPAETAEVAAGMTFQELQLAVIGRCTSGIVHDMNNLLAIIQGQGELLNSMDALATPARKMVRDILAATARARDLSRSIGQFVRPVVGKEGPIDGVRLIQEDLPLIRAVAPTVVELRYVLREDCLHVPIRAMHLHRILMNLSINAIDALAGKSGYVLIEAEPGEDDAAPTFVLRVSDSGPGMDAATMAAIFNPYFSTRNSESHLGLGLQNVAELVQGAKGTIGVESAPGCGATFTVELPAVRELAPNGVHEARPAGKPQPLRILYVDDEPAVIRIQRAALRGLGHMVTCISDAFEAERYFALHWDGIDLVITDACMPGMEGIELARRLKTHCPDVSIILLTGSHEAAAAGCTSSLIDQVLVKPVPPMDLDYCIRNLPPFKTTALAR